MTTKLVPIILKDYYDIMQQNTVTYKLKLYPLNVPECSELSCLFFVLHQSQSQYILLYVIYEIEFTIYHFTI